MVVALPTGVVHYNTTNMDIEVGSMLDELQKKISGPTT